MPGSIHQSHGVVSVYTSTGMDMLMQTVNRRLPQYTATVYTTQNGTIFETIFQHGSMQKGTQTCKLWHILHAQGVRVAILHDYLAA